MGKEKRLYTLFKLIKNKIINIAWWGLYVDITYLTTVLQRKI